MTTKLLKLLTLAILAASITMVATSPLLSSAFAFEDSKKDNDSGGGNDKKDSPSDDDSGGGNDPPKHRGNN